MVGHVTTATKPSRSDEVLDADEQLKIANQIRALFDSLAPKRPIKPSRSDPDAAVDSSVNSLHNNNIIPELDKFKSLQSHSHGIISSDGVVDAQDEFVETQYYKELATIDKQHHTTGSGFIKVVREGSEGGFEMIKLPAGHVGAGETQFKGYKSNPATNDWVPTLDEYQVVASSKPNRSESI